MKQVYPVFNSCDSTDEEFPLIVCVVLDNLFLVCPDIECLLEIHTTG